MINKAWAFFGKHIWLGWSLYFFAMLSVITAVTMVMRGSALESKYFPVNTDYWVKSFEVDGRDIILRGNLKVARQCQYLSPPQAKIRDGIPLIVTTGSPYFKQQWVAGERYDVGPWRIVGGAGEVIDISQLHQCHGWWLTVSKVVTFDARGL